MNSKTSLLPTLIIALCCFSCSNEPKESNIVNTIDTPSKANSAEAFLFSKNDELYLSWVENENDSIFRLKYSTLNDGKWQSSNLLATGDDWFVNWADFPAIAENGGKVLSHFLAKSAASTYAYDVHLVLANKNGELIKPDFLLNNDGTATEHGFVTMLPYQDDGFFVTWLDGRNTADTTQIQAMNVRAAIITSDGQITNDTVLDFKTCDCCQTSAAITSNGPIVVYRDRSDNELRDMSIVRLVDGSWTKPSIIHADNWEIKGCPVNGPKASAIDSNLAVVWFTAANGEPKVKLIFSDNAGESFSTPIIISEVSPSGRVDVAMTNKDEAIVSWLENIEGAAEIRAMSVNKSGSKSKSIVITSTSAARSSGFPQMELVGDKVYFAWTDVSDSASKIKSAVVNLSDF